jgi:Domain of unknown function (DUF4431)
MRMFRALMIFAAMVGASQAQARQQLSYEPTKVELSGTVVNQQFYGPPNFGEDPKTDRKVQVLELKLDAPVDVVAIPPTGIGNDTYKHRGADAESAYDVKHIGLVDLQYPANHLDAFLGQRVAVSGVLYHQDNALQYTEILLIVDKISARKTE